MSTKEKTHPIWLLTYPAEHHTITKSSFERYGLLDVRECYSTLLNATTRCTLLHLTKPDDKHGIAMLCGAKCIADCVATPFARNKDAKNALVKTDAFQTLVKHKAEENNPTYIEWQQEHGPDAIIHWTHSAAPERPKQPPQRVVWLVTYAATHANITAAMIQDSVMYNKATQCYTTLLNADTKCTLLHLYHHTSSIDDILRRIKVIPLVIQPVAKDKDGMEALQSHPAFAALLEHKRLRNPAFQETGDDTAAGLLTLKRKPTEQPEGEKPAKKERAKCEHKKRRYECKACGGLGICKHDRIKYKCTLCNGICPHGKKKHHCTRCHPSRKCKHGNQRLKCEDCNAHRVCPHKRPRAGCPACNKYKICRHKQVRWKCTACKAGRICEHKKHKNTCPDCKVLRWQRRAVVGKCNHGKCKSRCKKCRTKENP